jgi:hypothetical protein
MRSGGGSFGRIGLHVGADWWTFLNTYDEHTPILDIAAGSTTVTFSIADRKVDDSALEFAGSWPARRPGSPPRSSGCTPGTARTAAQANRAPGAVRPLDDDRWWGGRNGHSCRPGHLPLLAHGERRRV